MCTRCTVARGAPCDIQVAGVVGVVLACEFETSILMQFAPHLGETQAIADPQMPQPYCWAKTDMLNAPSGLLYRSMKTQAGGSGVVGRPSYASASKGARIAGAVTDQLCAMLGDLHAGG